MQALLDGCGPPPPTRGTPPPCPARADSAGAGAALGILLLIRGLRASAGFQDPNTEKRWNQFGPELNILLSYDFLLLSS